MKKVKLLQNISENDWKYIFIHFKRIRQPRIFENETIENCIIVAPLSLQRNWEIEISKWAPSLRYERLRSSDNTNTAILKKLGPVFLIIVETSLSELKE